MTEGGGRWRWDDVHEIFDDGFVDGASVREGDWREREKQGRRDQKAAAKAVRRARRRRYRLPVLALLLVLVAVGVATALGRGPTTWFSRNDLVAAGSVPLPSTMVLPTTTAPPPAPVGGGKAVPPGTIAPDEDREVHFTSRQRGDCFDWDPSSTDQTIVASPIDCGLPHRFEYAAVVAFGDQVDHYLTEPEWWSLASTACAGPSESLFEGPFDPAGRFQIYSLHPTHRGWAAGDRSLTCGIGSNMPEAGGPDGALAPLLGIARAKDQAKVTVVGSCRREPLGTPIDCAQPHEYEVAGTFDLATRTSIVPAADDSAAWTALVRDGCAKVVSAYLGRPEHSDEWMVWYQITQKSFDLGNHDVVCAVGKTAGGQAVPTTGSLKAV